MSILLVHGAWHAAWCWEKVLPLLGPAARAIDLPGHGSAGAPGWSHNLEDYAEAVVEAAAPGPTLLVGHSMGGLIIARAAERAPERVAGLVFLAAFMPRDGDSLFGLGREDPGTTVPSVTGVDLLRGVSPIRAAATAPVFYADCSAEDVAAAQARLQPQSLRPLTDKVRVTPDRFGRVRRFYVTCTEDRAVSYPFQERMMARVGVEDVARLSASHSPFLSQPAETAAALARFAAAAATPLR